LAEIWASFRRCKREQRLYEVADLLRNAVEYGSLAAGRQPELLVLYGFYDFTALQQGLVRKLVELSNQARAFLLWHEIESAPAPGFEYARPAVEFLQDVLGSTVRCLPTAAPETDLCRVRLHLFELHPPLADGEAADSLRESAVAADGSVRLLSCPGNGPEAVEVVREALAAQFPHGQARETVGLLLRGGERVPELLGEVCRRAGVQAYEREGIPLGSTRAGRILLNLLDVAAGDAEREKVVEFLDLADLNWPEGLWPGALDAFSRSAGITEGRHDWVNKLRAHAKALYMVSTQSEDDLDIHIAQRQAEICQIAAGFLDEFFEQLGALSSARTWVEKSARLLKLFGSYAAPSSEGFSEVLALIGGLSTLDVTGVPAETATVRWCLQHLLRRGAVRRGKFGRCAVSISRIMASRGPTYDTVIVPGLTEKVFPMRIAEDPIISERDREILNDLASGAGAGELPVLKRRPEEEKYLFRIALGSARRKVILSYPRIEEDAGRPRVASRFLLSACGALVGSEVDEEMFPRLEEAGLLHRIPLGRTVRDRIGPEGELDSWEYDLSVFVGSAGRRRAGYAQAVSPFFRRAAELEKLRWSVGRFGPCDGKIRRADLASALREEWGGFDRPISPSRLETYALCPFQYFLRYVLSLEEYEKPLERFELAPSQRGRLVHALLHRLYEEELFEADLGSLDADTVAEASVSAGRILDQLAQDYAQSLGAVWGAERAVILDQVKRLLEFEAEAHEGARPSAFELAFGLDGADAFRFQLGKNRSLAFRGRVDRVDALAGGRFRVTDYKTGGSASYRADSLEGGMQLQLPVYLLAASESRKGQAGEAGYLFVRQPRWLSEFSTERLEEKLPEFRRALVIIVDGIRRGDFFPFPSETGPRFREYCKSHCAYGRLCGPAQGKLAEMKGADHSLRFIRELRRIK